MQYDPIKRILGSFFNMAPILRVIFYKLLDILLLRSWHIRRELKKWIRGRKGLPSRVLDAGFGFGQYSYFVSGLSADIQLQGIDLKEEQVKDCNQFFQKIRRKNARFFAADLTTFVSPAAYDLILCVDVMEHILEDRLVLKNFHTSLDTGGQLLISTPSDQGGSDVHEHGQSSFIEEHVRDGYGFEEMTEKLKEAGFTTIIMHYSYGKAGSLSWRLSMKYPILLVNKSKLFFVLLPFYYLLTFPLCLVLNYRDVVQHNNSGTGLIVNAIK